MADPILPRAQSPINGGGPFTREWYDLLRSLYAAMVLNEGDAAAIAAILARLDAIEEGGDASITGPVSVQVSGTLADGIVQLQLQGDAADPGSRYVYGTDADGIKTWTPVLVENLTGSTYSTLQHFVNTMHSPGIITGGDLSQLDADTVRVSAGTGMVRVLDDDVSSLVFFDFPQQDFDIPADQDTRYYAVTYNAGSPTCVESLVFDWDKDTEIPLGSAVRFNGTMVVTPNKYRTGDPITNVIQRFDANFPANRDNSVGGLILGEVGTRNVTLSGGVIWSRLSDFTVSAKDSSVDSMISVYFNGTGLTFTSGVTQWDNQNYNDLGTGALVAIGNNKYANLWFFSSIDGSQYGFAYGTADYNSVGEAANEQVPAYLNQDFFNQSLLLGRFIFQESAATASLIESAFNTLFTTQAINTHNDLGGLQGGVAGEYYHLTAAEHTKVQALPSASQPLDATLTALAGQNWAANALPIGTGADTVAQVSFAANTFPARASSGNLSAKTITDDALLLMADADVPRLGTVNTWGETQTISSGLVVDTNTLFVDNVNKRVGIGTSTPIAKVELSDPANIRWVVRNSTESVGYSCSMDFLTTTGGFSSLSVVARVVAEIKQADPSPMTGELAFVVNSGDSAITPWRILPAGNFSPTANGTYTVGSASQRTATVFSRDLNLSGARFEIGAISPPQLTANTDNWIVAGIATAAVIRASTDASRNLTGIASPTAGQSALLVNSGAFDLVLVHDATSTAANRFLCPGSVNLTLNPNDSVRLWYDNTSSRWRVIGV